MFQVVHFLFIFSWTAHGLVNNLKRIFALQLEIYNSTSIFIQRANLKQLMIVRTLYGEDDT